MSTYNATTAWQRNDAVFTDNRYSRAHAWQFDGGCTVPASSSPHVVPLPFSDASAVDPEEAFVASLSGCHMLWFLSIAAKRGFVVDNYRDEAQGVMEKCADGKLAITVVTLRSFVTISGDQIPSAVDIQATNLAARCRDLPTRCRPLNSLTPTDPNSSSR